MVNSLVAACVNVTGELALSFGCGPIPALGYIGIAWASAIATTLGMSLNLMYVLSGPSRVTLGSLTTPLFGCIKNLVKLGVPTALQQTAWNAGTLVVYFLVAHLRGGEVTALAAMSAGVRIEAIIFLPIFGLNMASAVLTGNRLGAGDVVGARFWSQGDNDALSGTHTFACVGYIHFRAGNLTPVDPRPRGASRDDALSADKYDRRAIYGYRGFPVRGFAGSGGYLRHNEDYLHGNVAA